MFVNLLGNLFYLYKLYISYNNYDLIIISQFIAFVNLLINI